MFDSSREPQNTQSWLMDRMKTLGYTPKGVGICYGLAIMAMQAAIIGELDVFIRRIQLMKNIEVNQFKKYIDKLNFMRLEIVESAKKEAEATEPYSQLSELERQNRDNIKNLNCLVQTIIKNKLNALDEDTKISLEIPNFFEALIIGQSPEAYKEIFHEGLALDQNTLLTSPLTQSQKLDEQQGVSYGTELHGTTNAFSGVYDNDALKSYFSSMEEAIQSAKNKPITLMLVNSVHAIAVIAIPGKEKTTWWMIDANQLHLPLIEVSSSADIADQVFRAMKIGNVMMADELPLIIDLEHLQSIVNDDYHDWQSEQQAKSLEFHEDFEENSLDLIISQANENVINLTSQEYVFDESLLLSTSTPINHVIFSTDIYMDRASDAALTQFFSNWKNLNTWKKIHEVNTNNAGIIDAQNGTWLYFASRAHDNELAEKLLKAGANPDHVVEGNTPLNMAVENKNIKLVALLLSYGANPNIARVKDSYYCTPLSRSVFDGNIEAAQLLISHELIEPNIPVNGQNPLHYALLIKNDDMVNLLLSNDKTNPNAKITPDGRLPLWIAIMNGKLEIVELLLSCKANPDASHNTVPMLWLAAYKNRSDIMKILLSHSANPNIMLDGGTVSLLFFAAEKGLVDVVKTLVDDKRTDLNLKIETTIDCLNTLAENKEPIIQNAMKVFIDNNSVPDSQKIAISPMQIAKILSHIEIENLIKNKCAELKSQAAVRNFGVFANRDKADDSKIKTAASSDKDASEAKAPQRSTS